MATVLFNSDHELLKFKHQLTHFLATPGTIWIWGILNKHTVAKQLINKFLQVGLLDGPLAATFFGLPAQGYYRMDGQQRSEIWLIPAKGMDDVVSLGMFKCINNHAVTILGSTTY